ncbi:tripartite tricarboxylate transporter TctB family protein [Brevibacillus centrosporus]|uniref:tripartite tricarboxylate transporter TctB family protein n=1 Tax=Brevibacillus centrosporus TaxID=54910 RepID=UPI003808D7E0
MSKVFDRYVSVVCVVLGAFFMLASQKITQSAYGSEVGPNVFPFGLGLILSLLSLRLLYDTFRYKSEETGKKLQNYKGFLVIFIAASLYALFLEDIGYVISTFLFLLIGFQTMERGKWLYSIVISAALSGGIYYVYVDILSGTLPGFPSWLG